MATSGGEWDEDGVGLACVHGWNSPNEKRQSPCGMGFGEAKKNRFRGGLLQEGWLFWPDHCVRISALIRNITQPLTVSHEHGAILVRHRVVRHGRVVAGGQVGIARSTNQFPFNQRV